MAATRNLNLYNRTLLVLYSRYFYNRPKLKNLFYGNVTFLTLLHVQKTTEENHCM
jgi:hypothetical protein